MDVLHAIPTGEDLSTRLLATALPLGALSSLQKLFTEAKDASDDDFGIVDTKGSDGTSSWERFTTGLALDLDTALGMSLLQLPLVPTSHQGRDGVVEALRNEIIGFSTQAVCVSTALATAGRSDSHFRNEAGCGSAKLWFVLMAASAWLEEGEPAGRGSGFLSKEKSRNELVGRL